MNKKDKESLQNIQLTESSLIACLATCETVISKNAYLEKKWGNSCMQRDFSDCCDYNGYYSERIKWMEYREKIRAILLPIYSMKWIIQLTKGCSDKATQKAVQEVIDLIDKNDYVLM